MNAFLSPEEKTTEPVRARAAVHAVLPNAAHEKNLAALLEAAENEEQKRRTIVRARNAVGGIMLSAFALSLLTLFSNTLVFHIASLYDPLVRLLLVLLGPGSAVFMMCFYHLFENRAQVRQDSIAALADFADAPRSLLPIVDGLHVKQTTEWRNSHFPTLTECLWKLSATDAALSFDDTRLAALRRMLIGNYTLQINGKRKVVPSGYFDDMTTDLAVAIMKTLAGLGDKKSVKVLEKIIKAEAATPNETVVRDAAREYLPVLVQKITEKDMVQVKIAACLTGRSPREGQQMLGNFLDTLAPEDAKATMASFLCDQRSNFTKMCLALSAVACPFMVFCLYNDAQLKPQSFPVLHGSLFVIGLVLPLVAISLFGVGNGLVCSELAKRSGNDTRLLPLFLAFRSGVDTKQADAVKKVLARPLPLLQPGDAALVPPAQRAILRAWLKIPRNKKRTGSGSQTLTIAALDALAAIGDTKALPAAQKIARQTRSGSYHETELHEAALRCVEALRARKGKPG